MRVCVLFFRLKKIVIVDLIPLNEKGERVGRDVNEKSINENRVRFKIVLSFVRVTIMYYKSSLILNVQKPCSL